MKTKLFTAFTALCCFFSFQMLKAASSEGYVVSEKGAWCWFADPRALHYENSGLGIKSAYIGYIDVHGAIKAMQYDYKTNTASEVLIRSYFQPDDHDNPTFLALPDGRIMIFYSRHTDEACFYYRISQKPGDITTLGKEVRLATANNTTYPSPFILSDDPNHIYLCWRGINWHPTIARLTMPDANDNVTFNWGPKQIVQSTGARPYAKYASNGKDKIYLAYTTGHPDNESPNFIYFNHIKINTDITQIKLTDVKGKELSVINNGVHNVNKTAAYVQANPDAVVDNAAYRNWLWEVSMDAAGNPVIAMVRINDAKTSHDYYHAKWNGSQWVKTFLANGGGSFHQTPGLEMCYSGGMAIDDTDKNTIYCSVPVQGDNGKVYEILKYTVNANGTVSSEAVTQNSRKNNARPYCLPNAGANSLKLVWMNGDYYDWIVSSSRPGGYPTGICSNFELPKKTVDLNSGLLKHDDFENNSGFTGTASVSGGMLTTSKTTSAVFAASGNSETFSVSLSPSVSHTNYSGEIVKIAGLTYGLNTGNNPKPYVKTATETYTSSNVLGSSDVWKTQARGTGGQWYASSKLNFFNLTLTYENGVLKTYINGLIDQYIEIPGLTLSNVEIGGFEGKVEDCRIYNRVLLQDEVKQLSKNLADYMVENEVKIAFNVIALPGEIHTDIVMLSTLSTGHAVSWTSSNESIVKKNGLVTLPQTETTVTLTASIDVEGVNPKVFNVKVMPRDIAKNKVLAYEFETADLYEDGGAKYVKNKGGKGGDLRIFGSAQVDGTLNLKTNTLTGFSSNGYALAPSGVLTGLRSYTFYMKVNPERLDKLPRIYDFGTSSGNSVFGRLNGFCVGLKYNGGTTVMINSSKTLTSGKETTLAFTFDAASKTTKIYVDGEQTASDVSITREPYELSLIGSDTRNYVGRTQWWDSGNANDNADYCGILDDFYLFDIALTQNEINSLQTTSVNSIEKDDFFLIYPNVVEKGDNISIKYNAGVVKAEDLKVELCDTQGRILARQSCSSSHFTIKSPEVSGIYYLTLYATTYNRVVKRFIVK